MDLNASISLSVFNFLFVGSEFQVCRHVILLKRHFLSHLSIETKPKHFCLHEFVLSLHFGGVVPFIDCLFAFTFLPLSY